MPTILVTERIHDAGMEILRAIPDATVIEGWTLDAAGLAAALPSVNAIIVRIARVPRATMEAAPGLKIVAKHGVGCDNIDLAAARERGVTVAIAADANMTSVVEHTTMFILALAKNLAPMDRAVREDYGRRLAIGASDVAGKRILVLGYGRIGSRMAPVLRALGMEVVLRDILLDNVSEKDGFEVAPTLEDGLKGADMVTVHVPLDAETRNMIGRDQMLLMKRGAFVINCARGGIVDERALADLAAEGHVAGVAADVFSEEPIRPDNPLLEIEGALLTPHSAALSTEANRRAAVRSASNIRDFFAGGLPPEMVFPL